MTTPLRKNKAKSKVLPPCTPPNQLHHPPQPQDTDSEPSLQGMSPEQKRRAFTQKLRNLSQTLLDDHAVASVSPTVSPTLAAESAPLMMTPAATVMESVTSPTSPARARSFGRSVKTTHTSASSGDITTSFANAVTPIVDAIKAKTSGEAISNPPKTKTFAEAATAKDKHNDNNSDDPTPKIARVMSLGDQDAFTTIKNAFTYESRATMDTDSRWGTVTDDYGSFLPQADLLSYNPYDTYCSAATKTIDETHEADVYTQYTDYCNQTQFSTDQCNQTQFTDCYTQVTNYTAGTEMSQEVGTKSPFWYNLIFSCTEPAVYREQEFRKNSQVDDDDDIRGPLNPCMAPTTVANRHGKKNAVALCIAPSTDSGLGSLVTRDDPEEKRSHRSPKGTRFGSDDVRQTSFASSSSSSSSSSEEEDEAEEGARHGKKKMPSHVPQLAVRSKPGRRGKKKAPEESPFYLATMPQPHLHYNNNNKYLDQPHGRKSQRNDGKNNNNWLKQRLAGFRRKPPAAVKLPVRDEYMDYYDEEYEEDNSTISTKFSLMALRK